jgi:hypothetical protein
MAIAAGERLHAGKTAVASPMREVTEASCASSTTASWVHPSATPKRAYPSRSAFTARRMVASASVCPRRLRCSSELDAPEKTSLCRPFLKRLMGFEPTTFCMAISSSTLGDPHEMPANRPISAGPSLGWVSKNCAEITGV